MDSNTSPLAHFVATATEFQSPSHPPPFSDPPSQSNSPQHSPSSRGRELIPDNQPCRHAATAAAGLGSLGGAFRSVIPSRLSSSRPGSMSPPLSPAAPPATTQATAYPLPTGFSCTSRLGPTPATTTQSASATNSTPLSSRPSTPARLATDDPVLLSTLATADQASILVVVVEEDEPDTRADALSCKLGAIDLNASASRSAPKRVGGKGGRIYGGSQSGEIHVWHLDTMSLLARLEGHTGAVLALELVTEPDRPWLISSSGDGTVRVWHTPSLTGLYSIQPPHDNVGDIFSLAWVPWPALDEDDESTDLQLSPITRAHARKHRAGRIYAGCQDTSIMWMNLPPLFHLPPKPAHADVSSASTSSASVPVSSSSPDHHSLQPSSFAASASAASPLAVPVLPAHPALQDHFSYPLSASPPIHRVPNKFFDSLSTADLARRASGRNASSSSLPGLLAKSLESDDEGTGGKGKGRESERALVELQFAENCIANYAHFGYVYCLVRGRSNDRQVLISGSGDELVKLWKMTPSALVPVATLSSSSDAVLTLAVRDSTAFAGHQGGVIKVWDLDTFTCVRNLRPHGHDILTLTTLGDSFYSGASNGMVQQWDKAFNLVREWQAHVIALSSTTRTTPAGQRQLITGGNKKVRIWHLRNGEAELAAEPSRQGGFQDELFHQLAKMVSFETVADEAHREECRQGAAYLKQVLKQMGAETHLLPGAPGRNPIVLATFRANSPVAVAAGQACKRVLCYGHYDVVPVVSPESWTNSPFEMTGENGWIYGRGVSDNKGPMLAIAAAAAELRASKALDVDLVMAIEGEEETGSAGFQVAVRRNRGLIGDIDVVLVSNSYWIGEDIPCLTFGLRGVIHATVKITSDQPDLHSGMQGGVVSEPLVDMVRLLASLTDAEGRVRIPGFLDEVRPLGAEESKLYDQVIERAECRPKESPSAPSHSHIADPKRSLLARWRQPALSIHKVDVSGPSQKTLIPSWACSSVSIRIVPDQSLLAIVEQLKAHLHRSFASLRTHNSLAVEINHLADWWLGEVESPYFKAMAREVEQEWGIEPLYIREGGSIPSVPFLEREFGVDAVHLPMGTSSDNAHLPDERIRVLNLEKGKAIVSNWLVALGKM